MESPTRPSDVSAASDKSRSRLSDVSFPRPDSPLRRPSDSFAQSQQCSADPTAFVGFHVPPSAEEVDLHSITREQEKKQTLKPVVNLDSTAGNVRRGGDGFRPAHNPFSDLFAGEIQDDEKLLMQYKKPEVLTEKKKEISTVKRLENRSPPPTMLKTMETAWRARKGQKKQGKMEGSEEEECGEDSMPGASAYSEYSDDLAPRGFRVFKPTGSLVNAARRENENEKTKVQGDKGQFDMSAVTEDSDREAEYEDDLECTQQLDEGDEMDVTRYKVPGDSDDEETEAFPLSGTGILPYGAYSAFIDGDGNVEEENNDWKEVNCSGEYAAIAPSGEDEVTSREGSQATPLDYLTPRVNPTRIEKADSLDLTANPVVVVDVKDNAEKKAQDNEDLDDCVPTQPTKRTEDEPVVEPNSPSQQNISKIGDDILANKDTTGADSQTKAIRSLEFSFSVPESQDGEPHFSASLTSEGTPVAKRIEAFSKSDRPSPFETSISPVCLPTPTPTPTLTPVDDSAVPEITRPATETQASAKRKVMPSSPSGLPTSKKKQKTFRATNSSTQTTSTPKTKKRRRGFLSPDGNMSSPESSAGDPFTPRPPARRSARSNQSTPSSTPTIRTRTRMLTSVPSQRAYTSRSRTLFKYKFEFCLTGFVKTGEENLKELIEGHGGKIPERYQDVLYKGNSKAVVIATPVSWRKRKFMQAVACGIPVVHTDWIKDCIEAGYVIPFDGYQVPTGYSVTTRKFECTSPRVLHIFEGCSFGIASDVAQVSKSEAKDKSNLMAFILKACGADAVYENLSSRSDVSVDVVLSDEYTPTCRYYKKKRHIPVKDFQWVTECMIRQQFLDPEESIFEPQRVGCEDVFAASAEIGDSDNTRLKLYTGELVMADISGSAADHYLLFNVCEIQSIHVNPAKDEGSQSKHAKESRVMLRVGMLKREPYNPELSKTPVKVLDISSSQVKRRVVAISKEDYGKLKYKDESIFYLEDENKPDKLATSEHKWLTQ